MARRPNKQTSLPTKPGVSGPPGKSAAAADPLARANGLKFFRQHDYNIAIRLWTPLATAEDPALLRALAEAHFRRAVRRDQTPAAALADLQRATDLQPEVARNWFHLGRFHHLLGHLADAEAAYLLAAELGYARPGLPTVLALCRLEQHPDQEIPGLAELGPSAQGVFRCAQQLLQGTTFQELPAGLTPPWSELAPLLVVFSGMAAGEHEAARQALAALARTPLRSEAAAVRDRYQKLLGVTDAEGGPGSSARSGKSATALGIIWEDLDSVTRGAHLTQLYRLGAFEVVVAATEQLEVAGRSDVLVKNLAIRARVAQARAAREQNQWALAGHHYHRAADLMEQLPGAGSSLPWRLNAAVAADRAGDPHMAAWFWELALKALPRTPRVRKDPNPERQRILAQKGWVRRRIVHHYQALGDPDSALKHYRTALKDEPDDVELRFEFSEALSAAERPEEAEKQYLEVLARNPDHLKTLAAYTGLLLISLRMLEAEPLLRRWVGLEPNHELAPQLLAGVLAERAMAAGGSANPEVARPLLLEAHELTPLEPRFIVMLAEMAVWANDPEGARNWIARLLVPGADHFEVAFRFWVTRGLVEEGWAVLQEMERRGHLDAAAAARLSGVCATLASRRGATALPAPLARQVRERAAELEERTFALAVNRAAALRCLILGLHGKPARSYDPLVDEYFRIVPDDVRLALTVAVKLFARGDSSAARRWLHYQPPGHKPFADPAVAYSQVLLGVAFGQPTFKEAAREMAEEGRDVVEVLPPPPVVGELPDLFGGLPDFLEEDESEWP